MEQDCYDFQELISKFIDGEINYKEREFFENHLSECLDCRHLYENIKATQEEMSELPEPEVTPEFMEGLQEKILEAKEKEKEESYRPKGFFQNIPTLSYVFGACIILLIAGFSIYQYNQASPTKKASVPKLVKDRVNQVSSPGSAKTQQPTQKKQQQNLVSNPKKAGNPDSNSTNTDTNKNNLDQSKLNKMQEKIVPVQGQ